jgi:hypothetical protein
MRGHGRREEESRNICAPQTSSSAVKPLKLSSEPLQVTDIGSGSF